MKNDIRSFLLNILSYELSIVKVRVSVNVVKKNKKYRKKMWRVDILK